MNKNSLIPYLLIVAMIAQACISTKIPNSKTTSTATFDPKPQVTYPSTFPKTSSPTLPPTNSNTATPSFAVTPTLTSTSIPIMPSVSEWYTYTINGVSIQYPANWQVHIINSPEFVAFRLDEAIDVSPFYWINFEIYDRPIEQRNTADPHSWQPNEGSYEIHWEKTIMVDHIPGIEFIWGKKDEGKWEIAPILMAILYSETDQLDLRLTAGFDRKTIDFAMAYGFDKVVHEKYVVFDYMLQSIRIKR